MSSSAISAELTNHLTVLREQHGESVRVEDIVSVVESMMATMKGDLTAADLELYGELEALAVYIHAAKADIAALRPDQVKDEVLPNASDELDAIVAATETATNTIMDAAEKLEGLMDKVDEDQSNVIMNVTSEIYEACGFQDITGQRITKIVKALQDIEVKIDALVQAFGTEIENYKNQSPQEEDVGAVLTDEDLLNGPQLQEKAQTQEEIDALMASFD
jgi:chemotaxis protein CheZ